MTGKLTVTRTVQGAVGGIMQTWGDSSVTWIRNALRLTVKPITKFVVTSQLETITQTPITALQPSGYTVKQSNLCRHFGNSTGWTWITRLQFYFEFYKTKDFQRYLWGKHHYIQSSFKRLWNLLTGIAVTNYFFSTASLLYDSLPWLWFPIG